MENSMDDELDIEQILKQSIFTGYGRHYIHRGYQTPEFGWSAYANSYKEAADHLVNDMGSGEEIEIYAIVFLYRHALELKIKHHLQKMSEYRDIQSSHVSAGHDLVGLWGEYRRTWKMLAEDPSDEAEVHRLFADVSERAGDFARLDESSTELRYPIKRDGTPTMAAVLGKESAVVFDVYQVGLLVTAIFRLLDSAGYWLDERLESRTF